MAAHHRIKPPWSPRSSVRSARWTVALLASRHAVVHRTRGSFSASAGVGLVAWYWHFVDVVWLVVFTVVYLVGR